MRYYLFVVLAVFMTFSARADESFPKSGWKDQPSPLTSPYAQPGGSVNIFAHQYPQSFNYLLDNNSFNAELFGSMFESLLSIDSITAEYTPNVAASWTISDDKTTFTFSIDERAVWSDGTPITAHDVVFTFETILNPKNLTGPHKVGLEDFNIPEAVDDRTVRFVAREAHWRNLGTAGSMLILPKHEMEGKDFNRILFEFPIVSGPYKLGEVSEGRTIRMERREDWWGNDLPRNQYSANFQTLVYRFFTDQDNAYESFRRGIIDIFPVYMAKQWVSDTVGERFDKNWVVKQKVYNNKPTGFQGFAMNMRKEPYSDIRVRKALAYLINRNKMNSTVMYNQYAMQRSYYEDVYDAGHPCENPSFSFDQEKARELLKEAGWKANPETGLLEKDGREFVITFLTRSPATDKFLAIFSEDLKDVGITLKIDRKDWAAWSKDMDEFNYDMTWAAWGSGLFKDPESMWSSKEAERISGNNITGFKNDRVDELIEKQKSIFDVQERNGIIREIDGIISREVPYVLLWYIDYVRILYWNKFGTPPQVLSKFGDESSAYSLWWYDEDAAAELEEVMEEDLSLPERPSVIRFDETEL